VIADLPGVTDIGPVRPGRMWAIAGRKLFSISGGNVRFVVGLGKYERLVNPDGGEVDSNPFEVTALGTRRALVADAGANAVLVVNRRGGVNWVATLPDELVSTANIKALAGCPSGPADFCDLPDEIPAQGVATGVAIGPDGAYYVTELKGFPAPLGESRVWRIEPGTRRVHCDPADTTGPCTVVADGFTSIVDITFGPDGTAYVTELDEASWAAVEIFTDGMVGGTVNACDPDTWTCTEAATGLTMPMAVAVTDAGPQVLINALVQGQTTVVPV
jgi:hypothetical protein